MRGKLSIYKTIRESQLLTLYKANSFGDLDDPELIRKQEMFSEVCPICLDVFANDQKYSCVIIDVGNCEHQFHHRCISDWFKARLFDTSCPVCRIGLEDLKVNMDEFAPDLQFSILDRFSGALPSQLTIQTRTKANKIQSADCRRVQAVNETEDFQAQPCGYAAMVVTTEEGKLCISAPVVATRAKRARIPQQQVKAELVEIDENDEVEQLNEEEGHVGGAFNPDYRAAQDLMGRAEAVNQDAVVLANGHISRKQLTLIAKKVKVYVVNAGLDAGRALLSFLAVSKQIPTPFPLF